jgi:predicted RNA binding protein YcfA (HicA-like mRNA interferase family)
MKFRLVVKLIEADGWRLHHQTGSHRQYRHAIKRGTVTIAGKPGDEVPPKTLANILRQAGLKG